MSKIKESLLREQDDLLEYYSGFYEWLETNQAQSLSDEDINSMQEDLSKPSSSENIIVPITLLKPVNNSNYKTNYQGVEL